MSAPQLVLADHGAPWQPTPMEHISVDKGCMDTVHTPVPLLVDGGTLGNMKMVAPHVLVEAMAKDCVLQKDVRVTLEAVLQEKHGKMTAIHASVTLMVQKYALFRTAMLTGA